MNHIYLGKFENLDIAFNINDGIIIYNMITYRSWRHSYDFYHQLDLIKNSNLKYLCLHNNYWYFIENVDDKGIINQKYERKLFKEFILNNKDIIELDTIINILE